MKRRVRAAPRHALPVWASLKRALALAWSKALAYCIALLVGEGIIVLAVVPLIRVLFHQVLAVTGEPNITDQNLGTVLSHPLATLMLLVIAVLALAAVSLQLAIIVVMADRQQAGLALTVRTVALDVWRVVRQAGHYQSPLLFVYFFLLAPFGGFGLLSVVTRGIAIPPFVTREFMKTFWGGAGYAVVIALAIYVNVRLILTVPLIVVSKRMPAGAMGHSLVATHWQSWRLFAMIGAVVLAAVALTTGVIAALVGLAALADEGSNTLSWLVASGAVGLGQVLSSAIIGGAVVVVAHLLVGMTRAYWLRERFVGARRSASAHRLRHAGRVGVVAVTLASAFALAASSAPALAHSPHGVDDALVIGHRGAVSGGVENTIGALEAASRRGVDLVEVDMMQTKDGYFVASHDSNLLLLTGQNVNVFDLTLDEVTSIPQHEGGFTETIPTMRDYVKRAQQLGMTLLIEVKVTGHETSDYLDRFLGELDALDATEQNIYHSIDIPTVEKLKSMRPELRVGLTMAMSVGQVPDLDCDFYVLEQASYSTQFLQSAHGEDRPVYVWTVNSAETIRYLLRDGVDGIVTDIPHEAMESRDLVASENGRARRVHGALEYLTVL